MEKTKILLHSCCGPCSSAVLERLHEQYDITVLYYNPNIYPQEEYDKRVETQRLIINSLPFGDEIKLVVCETDYEYFDKLAIGHELDKEGEDRCRICFNMRLSGLAKYAAEHGFKYITTTLSISPHKSSKVLNEIGESIANEYKLNWVYSDFKKGNGYLRSIELSKEYGLYRQNYCGCKYSLRND